VAFEPKYAPIALRPSSLTWEESVASRTYIVKRLVALMPKWVNSYMRGKTDVRDFITRADAFNYATMFLNVGGLM
jgi:hypothetical protein